MGNSFHIKYIANCCLMVSDGETKVIIDGPYSNESFFDEMDPAVLQGILESEGEFADVDALIFTHAHADHFDPEAAARFMQMRKKKVIAPDMCFSEIEEAYAKLSENDGSVQNLIGNEGSERDCSETGALPGQPDLEVRLPFSYGKIRIGSMTLYYQRTKHLSIKSEPRIDHCSYVLESGDHRIFVTADMKADTQVIDAIEPLGAYDAAFLNVVVGQDRKWYKRFKELDVKETFIYHIPSEEKDLWNYRSIAFSGARRLGEPYTLLLEHMTQVL